MLEHQVFDLTGRVALVTGSSRGIGKAMALGLARTGADEAVHCVSRRKEAEAVASEIESMGRKSAVFAADLGEKGAPGRLVGSVGDVFGHIDMLVLNGSIEIHNDWVEIGESEFDNQVDTNLKSTLNLLQQTVPGMIERGWGRVVSVGSVQEAKPNPRLLIYAALKAAQTSMIINLARHLGATVGSPSTIWRLAPSRQSVTLRYSRIRPMRSRLGHKFRAAVSARRKSVWEHAFCSVLTRAVT